MKSPMYTFWDTNIAMENGPFAVVVPIELVIVPFFLWFTRGYHRLTMADTLWYTNIAIENSHL